MSLNLWEHCGAEVPRISSSWDGYPQGSSLNFFAGVLQVDRLYDWKVQPNAPVRNALKIQPEHVRNEFDRRAAEVRTFLLI
jgi:hypothetical protein